MVDTLRMSIFVLMRSRATEGARGDRRCSTLLYSTVEQVQTREDVSLRRPSFGLAPDATSSETAALPQAVP